MNNTWLEETRKFLNQPDDVYEEAPALALELLAAVDELRAALRGLLLSADASWELRRHGIAR